MQPTHLLNLSAVIQRVTRDGELDDFGDQVESVAEVRVRCWVAPKRSGEDTVRADRQSIDQVGWFPAGTDITGSDRVVVRGKVFEVVGPPRDWVHPRSGEVAYVEADLRSVV